MEKCRWLHGCGGRTVRATTRPPSKEESQMRAIDCPCGHRLEGADDEELRQRVAADAYEVTAA
jgi:hypothetical protein